MPLRRSRTRGVSARPRCSSPGGLKGTGPESEVLVLEHAVCIFGGCLLTSGPCDGKARRTGCMYGKVQMRSGRLRGSGRRGLSEGIVSRRRVIETGLVTTTERRGGTNAENEMLTIPEHRHTVVDCASLLHFFSERRAHPVRWASTTKSCIDIV